MKNLLLHCTDLDGWRWYNRIEDMTKDEFVGRLKRTAPANDKMKMGTAWHAVLENPPEAIDSVKCGDFVFRVECESKVVLPQIREVRACKYYKVGDVDVKLTGKVDGITGNVVYDHKLTFGANPENYTDAYQWRAYLDIFESYKFVYVIYDAIEKDGEIVIRNIDTMPMFRYPGMAQDLKAGITELVDFIGDNCPEMIK